MPRNIGCASGLTNIFTRSKNENDLSATEISIGRRQPFISTIRDGVDDHVGDAVRAGEPLVGGPHLRIVGRPRGGDHRQFFQTWWHGTMVTHILATGGDAAGGFRTGEQHGEVGAHVSTAARDGILMVLVFRGQVLPLSMWHARHHASSSLACVTTPVLPRPYTTRARGGYKARAGPTNWVPMASRAASRRAGSVVGKRTTA